MLIARATWSNQSELDWEIVRKRQMSERRDAREKSWKENLSDRSISISLTGV